MKIEPNKYQLFLLTCPASIPVMFARHPWFVINKMGKLSRWEVFFKPARTKTSWGHLTKDFFPPFQGVGVVLFSKKYFWKDVRLIGSISGGEDSLAAEMIDFIENSPNTYHRCHDYSLLGPNSNTYAQWVINTFPACGWKLPWNSFGKFRGLLSQE